MTVLKLFSLVLFVFLGSALKYLDIIFENSESHSKAENYLITAFAIVIWLSLSFYDEIFASILLAILLGSIFSGKVDNPAFKASALIIFLSLPFFDFNYSITGFLLPSSIADELGNEHFENFFFKHRFAMKLGMLLLFIFGYTSFYYFSALILFDLFYEATEILLKSNAGFSK